MVEKPATTQPIVRHKSWLLAPVLAAIYPVLSLYVASIKEADLSDALICGVVVVASAVALAYLLRLVFDGPTRASLAAVVLVIWCFTFSGFRRTGNLVIETVSSSRWNDYVLMGVWILILLASLYLLFRLRLSDERMRRLYQFVELACLFTIAFGLFNAATGYFQNRPGGSEAVSIWANDSEALPADWKPAPIAPARDVYFLVFDRYGSGSALQKYFGFDNSEFYDELEKRGFIVDRNAISSYPMTAPAMASTLNMRYLRSQFGAISDYFPSVESNEVAKSFIKAGYKYHYFGNFYAPLRESSIAQWNSQFSLLPCEFADSLVAMTPLRPLIGRQQKRQFVMQKFAELALLATNPDPTFAYAHFLVPHPPYVFARDGSTVSELARASRPEPELYIDQLVATNGMILKTIDDILSSSTTKPIIILQADEGPYLMAGDQSLSRDDRISKRNGILSAILIPDDEIRQRLPAPLLPVNTFRILLKEYFSAPTALLPDKTFYWTMPEANGTAAPESEIVELPHDRAVEN